MHIREYVDNVYGLIEKQRNELRCKVMSDDGYGDYSDLLNEFENVYMEKCLKIEELLDEEIDFRKRFEKLS